MAVGRPVRVGIYWPELASNSAQLGRIAEVSGLEPLIWDGQTRAPDIEVLLAGDIPQTVPSLTPNLRLLQLPYAGTESLRRQPIWETDVLITRGSGVHGVQIGEHVLMLLLALRRCLPHFIKAQERHEWLRDTRTLSFGDVYGLTMGLVGYGHIGRGVAHLARAFGMRVLATAPSVTKRATLALPGVTAFSDPPAIPEPELAPDDLFPLSEFDSLLAETDVLVICAALTPQTEGMIDAHALACLKPGAYLVNIARGKIVDEAALVQSLRDGKLAGAGLDVTAEEPLPPDSPLWEMPNVIITPHISGNSPHYVERLVNIMVDNLDRLRRDEPLINIVDRERGY